ncbi:hypothetical protein F5Y18DRAFT_430650 [Xylariaceae sp. FL1019]|nr:hypothetical protein F5Y18DRAFT_430650 [Xylariaceae sp. FL1019]
MFTAPYELFANLLPFSGPVHQVRSLPWPLEHHATLGVIPAPGPPSIGDTARIQRLTSLPRPRFCRGGTDFEAKRFVLWPVMQSSNSKQLPRRGDALAEKAIGEVKAPYGPESIISRQAWSGRGESGKNSMARITIILTVDSCGVHNGSLHPAAAWMGILSSFISLPFYVAKTRRVIVISAIPDTQAFIIDSSRRDQNVRSF